MTDPEATQTQGELSTKNATVEPAVTVETGVSDAVHTLLAVEKKEGILTRDEVIAELNRHVTNYKIVKELSDEEGLYYIEATTQNENPDEMTEYAYRRRGEFKEFSNDKTTIDFIKYVNGTPDTGGGIVNYDEVHDCWVKPEHFRANEMLKIRQ